VREAFELSIDREALNQVVFNGEFTRATSGWPDQPVLPEGFPVPKRDVARRRRC
jgi:peptide/nickel transport system substrate-binding protein